MIVFFHLKLFGMFSIKCPPNLNDSLKCQNGCFQSVLYRLAEAEVTGHPPVCVDVELIGCGLIGDRTTTEIVMGHDVDTTDGEHFGGFQAKRFPSGRVIDAKWYLMETGIKGRDRTKVPRSGLFGKNAEKNRKCSVFDFKTDTETEKYRRDMIFRKR